MYLLTQMTAFPRKSRAGTQTGVVNDELSHRLYTSNIIVVEYNIDKRNNNNAC